MNNLDLAKIENFTCEGVRVPHKKALEIWKLTYKTIEDFKESVVTPGSGLEPLGDYLEKCWKDIPEVEISDCFKEENLEIRRLYFNGFGMETLFRILEPKLLDKKSFTYVQSSWNDSMEKIVKCDFKQTDKYELYQIEGSKFFTEDELEKNKSYSYTIDKETVYAVRCWCTTTGREYWIYVPSRIGEKKNALEAIAWTVQLNITDPKYIIRQGDVIIAKKSEKSKQCNPYHLTAEQYTKLLFEAS